MAKYLKNDFYFCMISDHECIVVAKKSTQVIKDTLLIDVIKEIFESNLNKPLNKALERCDVAMLSFLENDLGVIVKERQEQSSVKLLYVISDSTIFSSFIEDILSTYGYTKYKIISSIEEVTINDSAIISFQIRYDEIFMKNLYKKINEFEKLYLISSYILGGFGYIDNLFYTESGYPCHFCNLGHIKGDHAHNLTGAAQSFFMIHNYILNNNLPINTTLGVTNADIGIIAKKVFIKASPLFLPSQLNVKNEKLFLFDCYDLACDKMKSDITLIWDYCSCLSGANNE